MVNHEPALARGSGCVAHERHPQRDFSPQENVFANFDDNRALAGGKQNQRP